MQNSSHPSAGPTQRMKDPRKHTVHAHKSGSHDTRAPTHTVARRIRLHTKRGGESEGLFTFLKRGLIELFKDPGGEATRTSVFSRECARLCVRVHA